MNVTWEAVTGLAALSGLIGTGFALYVRLMIRHEIDRGNSDLMRQINGTYIRRGEHQLVRDEIVRRLAAIEEKLS